MYVFLVEGANAANKHLNDASVKDEMPTGNHYPYLLVARGMQLELIDLETRK